MLDKIKSWLQTPHGKAFVAGLKQALRVVLMALIPVLIEMLNNGKVDVKQLGIVASVAFLSFVDKALHKYGKEVDNPRLVTGLTRF